MNEQLIEQSRNQHITVAHKTALGDKITRGTNWGLSKFPGRVPGRMAVCIWTETRAVLVPLDSIIDITLGDHNVTQSINR